MIPALPFAAWASGEMLGNHLWQSTLVAAAAALLALALRRNRAHVRYWLWLSASVKFLIPFAALVALGSQFGWRTFEPFSQPAVLVVGAMSQPFSQPALRMAPDMPAASGVDEMMAVVLVALVLLVAVWFAGCVALMTRWTIRWRRVAAAVRQGSRLEHGREVTTLRRLERLHGIKRPIQLVSSGASLEPGVFGIVNPVLLWPRTIAERLDDRQVESIITHELCHVLRHDNLASAIHMVVQALFWFHPLVWWLGTRLVDERERACDEAVIRMGSEPQVYAESILMTCQLSVESPLVCVAGVTGSDLKRRIEQILKHEDGAALNSWRKLLLGTAAILALAAPIAVGVVNAPRLRAEAPRPALTDHRGFGPPDVNHLVGFELLPGPPHYPTDDPRGAHAWEVAIDHPSGRMSLMGFTGRGLIRYAYALRDLPVVEGPSWIDADTFDVSTTTAGVPTDDDVRSALRTLLEDRFKLAAHRDTRNFPVYALVKTNVDGAPGPNLRPSTSDCYDSEALRAAAAAGTPLRQIGSRLCGFDNGLTGLTAEKVTMAELARGINQRLNLIVNRKIVDRTGLAGTFDVALNLGFLPAAAVLTRHPAAGLLLEPLGVHSIFTALPVQLGLRLEDATAPYEVLVIDRAEKP
jgi:bla regulator protein BlaR1